MAAPSNTTWGSIQGGEGRIGIATTITNTSSTQTSVNVEVWFWSKYSVSDSNNELFFDNRASSGSASTSRGSKSIKHTVATGSGWSTSNQTKLIDYDYTYTRGTSSATRYLYAKYTGIDVVGSAMYASKTITIPAKPSYTVSYNANGGSGAPSSQTKWYGASLTLSSTKPTRTGYSFQGWGTSASDTSVDYAAGASYTANAAVTLYAIWKADTYTVTYNANGGTGAPGNQTKTYGVTLKLSTTKPTRTNYTFLGWATSASATTATYSAGGSYTTNAKVTLYAVWKLAYTKPKISNLSATRCDSSGALTDNGTYAFIGFKWSTTNSVTAITVAWESAAGTDTGSTTISASGTSGTVSQVVGSGAFSTELSYSFTVTVADGSGTSYSTDRSVTMSGVEFHMDFGENAVAIGKPAESLVNEDGNIEKAFDVNWRSVFRNKIILATNNERIYGATPEGEIVEALQPQNSNGNTVIGWGNYSRCVGNTNIYGYDVNIGVSNVASSTTFRPYFRRGDSFSIGYRGAGYVTDAGRQVVFIVPLAKPIVGSPTVTVTSGNGFTLRQNNAYTHGSSASTYCIPDSYECAIINGVGIYINARFTTTTNVVNNAPIGIYWGGTITFS